MYYDQINTLIGVMVMGYKLLKSIPPDDGKSQYKPFSSTYGSIPYRYDNEDRIFLFKKSVDNEVSSIGLTIFAHIGNQKINITPPPGVSMSLTPNDIGASKIEIITSDEKFEYTFDELVIFPFIIDYE